MNETPGWTTPEGTGRSGPPAGWSTTGRPDQPPPPPGQPPQYGQQPYGQFAPRPPAAAKPGIVPLRPLGLGELYDGAFQAIRRNPRTMLGAAAAVITVLALVDVVLQLALAGSLTAFFDESASPNPDLDVLLGALGGLGVYGLVTTLLQLLGVSLITGMLILVVSRAVLGQRMSLGELWTAVRPRLLALVVVNVVVGLICVAAFVLPVALGALGLFVADWVGALLVLLGLLVGFALAIYLGVRLSMAIPVLVLEEASIGTALGRTWGLVRGSFWRVAGILALTGLVSGVTALIISAPFALVGGGLGFFDAQDPMAAAGLTPVQLVVNALGTIVANTIVYPFTAAATALLYIDLRMRREGLDVELARSAGSPTA